ncbi:unnamed protein product [Medioppia subpectinata]|uniref:F-box domain-containing protein n=1 Tax=Medioppia subpectinata TaxID=1979941 RepID=A0A7R9KGV7_9ACAR|nr:unnamed protein product [Medioppia subpectinata]CAG2103325.1 unnamed protein product [Medioppia subpectinata]
MIATNGHVVCPLVGCHNNGCPQVMHECKLNDHLSICHYQKTQCLNWCNGCPALVYWRDMRDHLFHCPANWICCKVDWMVTVVSYGLIDSQELNYSFTCGQNVRRDKYEEHIRTVHQKHDHGGGGSGGDLVPQTPAQAYSDGQPVSMSLLPFEILQNICQHLDSFSLNNLSLTSTRLRDVCRTFLDTRGLVSLQWQRSVNDNGKYSWDVGYKKWRFSSPVSHTLSLTLNPWKTCWTEPKLCTPYPPVLSMSA